MANVNLVALQDARERAVELITDRYSHDVIDDDELERRLERVQDANTLDDLAALTADLQPPPAAASVSPAPAESMSEALVPAGPAGLARISADAVPERSRSLCVFGDTRHEGSWTPAREIRTTTVLGDTQFDFRDARFGPGEITIKVKCVLGDVVLLVPPGLEVELSCATILSDKRRDGSTSAAATNPDAPRLRIEGVLVLSDLRVEECLPGETRRQARKRRKRERKLAAAQQRARASGKHKRLGDGS